MKFVFGFLALLCLWTLPQQSDAYKVLGVFPTMSKSHYMLGSKIMKELADKGHEVTVLTPFPMHKGVGNLTEVLVDGIVEKTACEYDNNR